jgi:sRNA-binding carbon storage regulator CsrA
MLRPYPFLKYIYIGGDMLSLTRRKNQSIVITLPNREKITVHVSKTSNTQCQLNFDLPSKMYIVDRAEVHDFFERRRKQESTNAAPIEEA